MNGTDTVRRLAVVLGPLLLLDALLFWLGLTQNAITIGVTMKTPEILGHQFRLADDRRTYSIIEAIWKLKEDGNTFLFLIVGLFSVVFPVVKLIGNGWIYLRAVFERAGSVNWQTTKRWAKLLGTLSKWSMLEVFMAALLCSLIKTSDTVRVLIHPGMYWFCAAVVVSIVNAHLTKKLLIAGARKNAV